MENFKSLVNEFLDNPTKQTREPLKQKIKELKKAKNSKKQVCLFCCYESSNDKELKKFLEQDNN